MTVQCQEKCKQFKLGNKLWKLVLYCTLYFSSIFILFIFGIFQKFNDKIVSDITNIFVEWSYKWIQHLATFGNLQILDNRWRAKGWQVGVNTEEMEEGEGEQGWRANATSHNVSAYKKVKYDNLITKINFELYILDNKHPHLKIILWINNYQCPISKK